MQKFKKAITFSYDDGVTQDIRLIEILNKYNLKGTFNLNSELLGFDEELEVSGKIVSHKKNKAEDVLSIYQGHEVAVHTLTHPLLTQLNDGEVIRQVEQDRINLSELVKYEVVGMAYPCGGKNTDKRVAGLIQENTGVKYARGIENSEGFSRRENLYQFKPTCYHHNSWDDMFKIAEQFFKADTDELCIFYIWGHSYEFDALPNRWEEFDEFCKFISGRKDVFYGSNKEILLGEF